MEILKKFSYVLTACVFLLATACSSGTGSSSATEEPVEEPAMEAADADSTMVEMDSTAMEADSVMTDVDSVSAE